MPKHSKDKNILKNYKQTLIGENKFNNTSLKHYQFYKTDKSYTKGEDIANLLHELEVSLENKKKTEDYRIHIIGIHKTGEKVLKDFDHEYDFDEFIDYFDNKVKHWKDFDDFFQVIFTIESKPKPKFNFK
jgi:hypothetical protein